jgi:hypothetical protein
MKKASKWNSTYELEFIDTKNDFLDRRNVANL